MSFALGPSSNVNQITPLFDFLLSVVTAVFASDVFSVVLVAWFVFCSVVFPAVFEFVLFCCSEFSVTVLFCVLLFITLLFLSVLVF